MKSQQAGGVTILEPEDRRDVVELERMSSEEQLDSVVRMGEEKEEKEESEARKD